LTGVKLLNEDIDGKSISPVIRSAKAPSPHGVLHWHLNGGKKDQPQWAVRQGDWKLIGNVQDTSGGALDGDDKKLFLANLALDVSEKKNLAKENPEVVERLLKLHQEWLASQKATAAASPYQDIKGNEQ
jgi:arylsulfatase A-like enzyme